MKLTQPTDAQRAAGHRWRLDRALCVRRKAGEGLVIFGPDGAPIARIEVSSLQSSDRSAQVRVFAPGCVILRDELLAPAEEGEP